MPDYLIKITTDVVLDTAGLERIEDVVYDVLVDEFGGSTETTAEDIGITDVQTVFN